MLCPGFGEIVIRYNKVGTDSMVRGGPRAIYRDRYVEYSTAHVIGRGSLGTRASGGQELQVCHRARRSIPRSLFHRAHLE